MAEHRKEIGIAVTMAVVLAVALGAAAVYVFPSNFTSTVTKTGISTTTTVSTSTTEITLPVTSSTSEVIQTSTSGSSAQTTSPSTTWEPGQVVGLVLNSSTVQLYISSAYSYDIVGVVPTASNPDLIAVTVNITGTQSVSGNYSTGYTVTYTGIETLKAEVQFTAPSSYALDNVAVTALPDMSQTISYNTTQLQVIQVALSNSTVKGLIGTQTFYVQSVTPVLPNGTYTGDYFAFLSQINGIKEIGVFVNGGMTAVVNSYTDSRTETTCWTLGTIEGTPATAQEECFTSPWNSTS